MATEVSSVTRHFPSAENGFTTTTSGSVSSGATTVGLNSVAGYSNGEVAVFVIDPTDVSKKQTFTGVIDTSGVQVTNVVWTAGTNQTHALGATVVDYATATHISMVSKGLLRDHNQSGYHKTLNDDNGNEWIKQSSAASAVNEITVANAATGNSPTISASGGDTNIDLTLTPKGTGSVKTTGRFDSWISGLPTPNTITCNGNRSYDLVFNSTDLTTYISPGSRLKLTRTVTAPTGAISLNGSSQYLSKSSPAGMAQTDTITESIWIKPDTYKTAGLISRNNGTTDGWKFYLNSSGQVVLAGARVGDDLVTSVQSVPLNKWMHVSASINTTTTTGVITIDGISVPVTYTNNANTGFAAPTQAYLIGATNGASPTDFFSGKLAQAASYSAVITTGTILAASTQTLTGSETSLVSAYKLDQASGLTDLSANANNLTANGSPTYATDTPFTQTLTGVTAGTTNYAIVQKAAFSTNTTLTVQVPEGDTIPTSGGVSAVSYSQQKAPYGFPAQRDKWAVYSLHKLNSSQSSPANGTWYNTGFWQITAPVGEWTMFYKGTGSANKSSTTTDIFATLSTANNTIGDQTKTSFDYLVAGGATAATHIVNLTATDSLSATTATLYYMNIMSDTTNASVEWRNDLNTGVLRLDNAYL